MSIDTARDKLVDEFSSVLSEAESLLDKASKETGERARDLRSQVEARLLTAKLKLQEPRRRSGRPGEGRGTLYG